MDVSSPRSEGINSADTSFFVFVAARLDPAKLKSATKSQASACLRSSIKSCLSSKPIETRTLPGLTPARFDWLGGQTGFNRRSETSARLTLCRAFELGWVKPRRNKNKKRSVSRVYSFGTRTGDVHSSCSGSSDFTMSSNSCELLTCSG